MAGKDGNDGFVDGFEIGVDLHFVLHSSVFGSPWAGAKQAPADGMAPKCIAESRGSEGLRVWLRSHAAGSANAATQRIKGASASQRFSVRR